MGIIVRGDGFEVHVHGRDHGVPHAHVWCGGVEAVIAVGLWVGRAYLLEPGRMRPVDVRKAVGLVNAHRDAILAEWEKFNGQIRT